MFLKFSANPDKKLLHSLKTKAEFIVMHLHGPEPRFKEIVESYPVDAINWHDQTTSPNLIEAKDIFRGVLFGGIDETGSLRNDTIEQVGEKILDTLTGFGRGKLVVAPGCVIPQDVPNENIESLVNTVKKHKSIS